MITTYDEMAIWLYEDRRNMNKFKKCLARVFNSRMILIEDEEASAMITAFNAKKSKKRIAR